MKDLLKEETGYALITVLFIILFITVSLGILLNYLNIQSQHISRKQFNLQSKLNTESGINKIVGEIRLTSPNNYFNKTIQKIEIANGDSVKISLLPWGAFLRLESTSNIKQQLYRLSALIGFRAQNIFHYALINDPQYSPLVLTGNARIIGNVLTGPRGVRKGNMRGKPYSGGELVTGQIFKTTIDERPTLNIEHIEKIFNDFDTTLHQPTVQNLADFFPDSNGILNFSIINQGNPITINFDPSQMRGKIKEIIGPANLIINQNAIFDYPLAIKNYVRILSKYKITILSNFQGEQLIIYSRDSILINFHGNIQGQIFSRKNITIQAGHFSNPSLIFVYSKELNSSLNIGSEAIITGSVVYALAKHTHRYQTQKPNLFFQKGAILHGLLFSTDFIELKGVVNGTVITDRFFLYSPPTVYYNWIDDGVINRKGLNENIFLPLIFNLSAKHIIPFYYE